jgi:hypothetical protein
LLSHDLEDIVALIDGRPEITQDVLKASEALRHYLAIEFISLMRNDQFLQALPGHLNYSQESESRKKIVESRIQAIIDVGKEK